MKRSYPLVEEDLENIKKKLKLMRSLKGNIPFPGYKLSDKPRIDTEDAWNWFCNTISALVNELEVKL